jgi:hypothetical protein
MLRHALEADAQLPPPPLASPMAFLISLTFLIPQNLTNYPACISILFLSLMMQDFPRLFIDRISLVLTVFNM